MNHQTALFLSFKATVATLCAYETFAITTDKTPTISKLCNEYPALIPVILGGLAVHFNTGHVLSDLWRNRRK